MKDALWKRPAREITADLVARVHARYSGNGCFVLEQVRNAGGFDAHRAIDLVAMETWPSRGYTTRAFEVKATRSDWLGELKVPGKSAAFAQLVDEFWIVSPPEVARLEELPEGYGLLHGLGDARLKVVRNAVVRRSGTQGEPLAREFMAALLMRAMDPKGQRARTEEIRAEERAHFNELLEQRRAEVRQEFERLEQSVALFEAASGVKIGAWNGQQLGEAVAVVMRGDHQRAVSQLTVARDSMRRGLASVEASLAKLAADA